MFWTGSDVIVNRGAINHHLFSLIDAKGRTGVTTGEDNKIVGAYSRDSHINDSNCTSLLQLAGGNRLALELVLHQGGHVA